MRKKFSFILCFFAICLSLAGCAQTKDNSVYIAPQPSGMEDALVSSAGMLAVGAEDPSKIPTHWHVPNLLINRKPSLEELKDAIKTNDTKQLAILLRENEKRFLLIERSPIRGVSKLGKEIAEGEPLEGFNYFGLSKEFVLLTIEHERPNLSDADKRALFAIARRAIISGEIPVEEAPESIRQPFYVELALTLFQGDKNEKTFQAKGTSLAEAVIKAASRINARKVANELSVEKPEQSPLELDIMIGSANFEDPDNTLFDEFVSPGLFGLSVRRYVPMPDGSEPDGFYYFLPPIVFNQRGINSGYAFAKKLCKEAVNNEECFKDRANIMRRFETVSFLEIFPKMGVLELYRGRAKKEVELSRDAVIKGFLWLMACTERFVSEGSVPPLYIDAKGKKATELLENQRVKFFYAPYIKAVSLISRKISGFDARLSNLLSQLDPKLAEEAQALAVDKTELPVKMKLYNEDSTLAKDLIGGIKGDKWRGIDSFSAARYPTWLRSFPDGKPPKTELDSAVKFILYWLQDDESIGFRTPKLAMNELRGCIARSPTATVVNPIDQTSAMLVLALWLNENEAH